MHCCGLWEEKDRRCWELKLKGLWGVLGGGENRGAVADSERRKYRRCCEFREQKLEALLMWILETENRF